MKECPDCKSKLNTCPITQGGEKIIGRHKCCSNKDCDFEIDLPLKKTKCRYCHKQINFYDTQHLNVIYAKHIYKEHREHFNKK